MHGGLSASGYMAHRHHLVGKQAHRPATTTLRRFHAGHGNQMRLGLAVQSAHSIGPFLRVLVSGVVKYLDNNLEGDVGPVDDVYRDLMDSLREA